MTNLGKRSSDKRSGQEEAARADTNNGAEGSSRLENAALTTNLSSRPLEGLVGDGPAPTHPSSVSVRSARMIVESGQSAGTVYKIAPGDCVIGRDERLPVDIDLSQQEGDGRPNVSRLHACIHFESGLIAIEDLGSSNGTFVNQCRVRPGILHPLNDGDVLEIGNVRLRLECDPA